MIYKIFASLLIGACFFYGQVKGQGKTDYLNRKIIIQVKFPATNYNGKAKLEATPYDYAVRAAWKSASPFTEAGAFTSWILLSDAPLVIRIDSVQRNKMDLYEPGDSVFIDLSKDVPVYSGRGAEKFQLLEALKKEEQILIRPKNPAFNETNSVEDYFEWSKYLDKKHDVMKLLFQKYKDKISSFAYEYLKANQIVDVEYTRLLKFSRLMDKSAELNLSHEALGLFFDSTAYHPLAKWIRNYTGKTRNSYYYYDFVRKSVQRKYNFDYEHDSLKGPERKVTYANLGKKLYRENILQGFMTHLLTESGLKEHTLTDGTTPQIEHLLDEFYAMQGYPEYKAYVKDYERWIRQWITTIGMNAPGFSLEDVNAKLITKEQFKGKLVVISFLNTSKSNTAVIDALKTIRQTFYKNPNVVLINISIEKDNTAWKKSLSTTNYQIKDVFNLYTNGLGVDHPLIRYYGVNAYPQFFLLDGKGKFLYNNEFYGDRGEEKTLQRLPNTMPDPRNDNGNALISKIHEQLALMNDGPYVFHEKDHIIAYSIQSSKVSEQRSPAKSSIRIIAGTDDFRKTFPVQLKSKKGLEPSVTAARPQKLFVLSDIEGEFEAFRKLLQANKIINSDFNWTFGKGHLVFAGDMFDRGVQVTECLWLVYVLEEKAKAAGGYVHFILGNHEIMNLQGDHRYVEDKYKDNAVLMGKTLAQLYNEDSELGMWLRTKNIVEKIGDLLFAHGGISAEMSKLKLPVTEINKLARPNYASRQNDYKDARTNTIMSSKMGPFWYRGYYDKKSKATETGVDSILNAFKVKHIVTGHTIVADTISIHYGGKVVNTDTKHRDGKSEALLIEGTNFYRVNAEGKRVLLFRDEEK